MKITLQDEPLNLLDKKGILKDDMIPQNEDPVDKFWQLIKSGILKLKQMSLLP